MPKYTRVVVLHVLDKTLLTPKHPAVPVYMRIRTKTFLRMYSRHARRWRLDMTLRNGD